MVVGMQLQQQQPHASPATVLEDATTPYALSLAPPPPSSPVLPSLAVNGGVDAVAGDECSSSNSSNIIENRIVKTDLSMERPLASSNGRVKLRDVNPHLVCVLCRGYFVDATTITECLHSFCRSCIILYLATKNFCPICEVQINNTKPHLSLKLDKTLQDIVYKLVPGLFHAEMKRRNQFYQDYPNRDLYLHPEFRGIMVDRLVYSPEDHVCLSLEYYDKSKEKEKWESVNARRSSYTLRGSSAKTIDLDNNDNFSKKYYSCPVSVRVSDIKKLIRDKYLLGAKHKVELFYRRESLQDDYSLMDIAYIYAWKRNSPIQLYFSIDILVMVSELIGEATLATTAYSDIKSSQSCSEVTITSESSEIPSVATARKVTESPKASDKDARSSTMANVSSASPLSSDAGASLADIKPINDLLFSSAPSYDVEVSDANVIRTVTPKSKLCSITTPVAVHITPKVTTKLKSLQGDLKKSKSKLAVNTSISAAPIIADKTSVSPIKSYLTISSILNELDKPEARKTPTPPSIAKNFRPRCEDNKKNNIEGDQSAVSSSHLTTVVSTLSNNSVTKSAVSNPAMKASNSLSSIVQLLTSGANATAVDKSKCEKAKKVQNMSLGTTTSKIKPVISQCNTSISEKTKSTNAISVPLLATSCAPSSSHAVKTLPGLTISTTNAITSPKNTKTLEQTVATLMIASSVSSMCTDAVSTSSTVATSLKSGGLAIPVSIDAKSLLPRQNPNVITLSKVKPAVTSSVASSALVKTILATSTSSSPITAVKTVMTTPASSTATAFVQAVVTTSSSSISSTSVKSVSSISTSRPIINTSITPSLTTSPTSNKTAVTTSALSISTSAVRTVPGTSANGIPPLTPISTALKNIQNSPIKNLNKKLCNDSFKNGSRSIFSFKNRNMKFSAETEVRKRNGLMVDVETPKRPRLTNGAMECSSDDNFTKMSATVPPPLFRPQVDLKTDYVSAMKSKPLTTSTSSKKEGSARHRSIPNLININEPAYAKYRMKCANNFSSALSIKPPPPQLVSPSVVLSIRPPPPQLMSTSAASSKKPPPPQLVSPSVALSIKPPPPQLASPSGNATDNVLDLSSPSSLSPRGDKKAQSRTKRKNSPSPSPTSIGRVEQKLLSPINKLERKQQSPMGAGKVDLKSSPHRKQSISSLPSPKAPRQSPSAGERMSPTVSPGSSKSFGSPMFGSPMPFDPNFYNCPAALNLFRQQWLFNINSPIPPHPLMHQFLTTKPTTTSQESMCGAKK